MRVASFRQCHGLAGFSLLELLAVIAIMATLCGLVSASLGAWYKASTFSRNIEDISSTFQFAHFYAMANNTYVYVGVTEVDQTQGSGATPQTGGVGRVVMTVVSTCDGTSDLSTFQSSYGNGSFLQLVRPTKTFSGIHLTTGFANPANGNMARPDANPQPLGNFTATPFSLPLGSTQGTGKYNFSTVVCFSPQGSLQVNGGPVQWLEIDLQPVFGNVAPNLPSDPTKGEIAAEVLEGATGAETVYRP